MDFGKEMRKDRIDCKKTQEEIADILGWPASKVSKIENGHQEPTAREYFEFKEALGAQKIVTFTFPDWRKKVHV